jgi:uncharacterized repeat protein (TIGR03843 family)
MAKERWQKTDEARSVEVRSRQVLEALVAGEVEVLASIVGSSNGAFLVRCHAPVGAPFIAVYKPLATERPLWDFPPGLGKREVAAYWLSQLLGFPRIPETVWREHAPLGPGSLQRFIPFEPEEHYLTLVKRSEYRESLVDLVAFDLVANNADRKSGHVLLGLDGSIWGIDHGLCFHQVCKLRTVAWDFSGERLPDRVLESCKRVLDINESPDNLGLESEAIAHIHALLHPREVEALVGRAASLVRKGCFPDFDEGSFDIPWPPI